MLMRDDNAIEPVNLSVQELHAKVGRAVDKDARSLSLRIAALHQKRTSPTPVLRVVWVARAPAESHPRNAHGRAAAQNGEGYTHAAFAKTRGTLLNSVKKFSV